MHMQSNASLRAVFGMHLSQSCCTSVGYRLYKRYSLLWHIFLHMCLFSVYWIKNIFFSDVMRTLYFLTESKPDVIFIDEEIIIDLEIALMIARLHDKMRIFPKLIILDKQCRLTKVYDSLGSILNSEFNQFDIDTFTCAKHSEKERIITMYSSNTANYPGEAYICYGAFLAPSNNQTPVMKSDDIGLWYESLNWTHSLLLTIRCILSYVTAIKSSTFSHENLCQIVDKYKVM